MLILTGVLVSLLIPSCEKGLPAGSAGLSCEADEDEAGAVSTPGDEGAGEDAPEPPPSLARRLLRICPS
jgi:hypothetical protein